MAKTRRICKEEGAWIAERYKSAPDLGGLLDDFEEEFGWRPKYQTLIAYANHKGLIRHTRVVFNDEQDAFMAEFVPGHHIREVVDEFEARFGVRLEAYHVKNWCSRHGVRMGVQPSSLFVKGQKSWNKGIPWTEICKDPEKRAKVEAVRFKAGRMPKNSLERLSEAVKFDGLVYVKVDGRPRPGASRRSPNDIWISKQRYIWEKEHGPLPDGMLVRFADGDNRNFDPENLVAVTLADNARLNSLANAHGVKAYDASSMRTLVSATRLMAAADGMEKEARKK